MEQNIILSALNGDEKLLWSGKPCKFDTLDKVYKPKFITDSVISLAIMLTLLITYIVMMLKDGSAINIPVVVIIVACGLIAPISVFSNASKLRKTVSYAITDKRLIIALDRATSVDYELIKDAKLVKDNAGITSLVCGKSAVKAKAGKLRGIAVTGCHIDDEKKICDSAVFYGIEDPDKLKTILKPYLKLN